MLIRWKPYPADEYAGSDAGGGGADTSTATTSDAAPSGGGEAAASETSASDAATTSKATENLDYDYGDMGDVELESPTDPKADATTASDGKSKPSADKAGDAGDDSVTDDTADSANAEQRSAAPQFDAALLQRAAELQFTYQDVSELGSNKALAAAIRRTEVALQASAPPPEQPPPTPSQLDSLIARAEANVAALEQAGYDESILEKARIDLEVLTATRDRDVQQQQAFAQQQQASRQQALRERDRRFDGFVEGLGEEYATLFGKGGTDSLAPTTAERSNREEIRQEMHVIAAGRHHNGLPPLTEDQLFKRALNSAFGDHSKTIARNEVLGKVKTLAKQSVARPSQTRERQLSGEAKAIARTEAWAKAHADDFE